MCAHTLLCILTGTKTTYKYFIYAYGLNDPSSEKKIEVGATLNSAINTAGSSKDTSPCITTSLPPVGVSPMEAPDENFFPNTLVASFNFKSGTVSNPVTEVTYFFFCRCILAMTTWEKVVK
jgi:hypothetical protein